MVLQLSPEKAPYLADLEALAHDATDLPTVVLQERREQAARDFAALEFPTPKHEDWKYTNVAPLLHIPFRRPVAAQRVAREDIPRFPGSAPDWVQLTFVNGAYAPELSDSLGQPGVTAGSLAGATAVAEQHLGDQANAQRGAFVALNTASLRDAAVVHVPAGKIVESPIHLVFVTTPSETDTVSHPRVLIVLGRGSMATVVESYVSVGGADRGAPPPPRTFSNAVTEIVLGEGASLVHYKLLREDVRSFHVGFTAVRQERDSTLTSFAVSIGNALSRSELQVDLNGEGATCTLSGLYVADGAQHMDHHTAISHRAPHCTSRQVYKGILDGQARAVFNGKVVVHPGAHATDAQQSNRNLILSDEARVDTKPQLEIRDDDVRCTHGATIGQLDDDQIFYLKARGLSEQRARTLLTYAFASEVLKEMTLEPVRVALDTVLLTRLEPDTPAEDLPHV